MKAYIVATCSEYTVLTLADSKKEAELKANVHYYNEYGEIRNDWTAYKLKSYLEPNEVMAIRSWYE